MFDEVKPLTSTRPNELANASQYAELLYGIKEPGIDDADGDEEEDIEAAVKKELDAMKATGKDAKAAGKIFTPVKMNVACLLFVRTRAPIEPVSFVKRICEDAKIPGKQRCRYVNRLIPMTGIGRATEAGLFQIACQVLGETFQLKREKLDPTVELEPDERRTTLAEIQIMNAAVDLARGGPPSETQPPPYTVSGLFEMNSRSLLTMIQFAIRPSIRNNNTLTRDVIIKNVAGLVDAERHKVSLEKPDKVILIEVYQNACGLSVVDGDYWDELRKYNLTELYGLANKERGEKKAQEGEDKAQPGPEKSETMTESTGEATAA